MKRIERTYTDLDGSEYTGIEWEFSMHEKVFALIFSMYVTAMLLAYFIVGR